jgi:Holliday junction DNA helicase RuvB
MLQFDPMDGQRWHDTPAFQGTPAYEFDDIGDGVRESDRLRREARSSTGPKIQRATKAEDRSRNELRPTTFDEIVGQEDAKRLMTRVLENSRRKNRLLDHVLLVAGSGLGKSTFSHVIAGYLGVDVFEVEAPVSHDTLMELREQMDWGDILRIEEIHMQAVQERRGKSSSTQPEVLFSVMEDRVIQTAGGVLPFPEITVIGTTTDEGMLPDPFVNRFPLRPVLVDYSERELRLIARMNADRLGISLSDRACEMFASASRGIPRQINNYLKNAESLSPATGRINTALAREVLHDLNGVTDDGLTRDMQGTLTFLYTKAKQTNGDGEVKYQASVGSIATAIGKSRDVKAIQLRVEPWLIKQGFIQVTHGGRRLTDLGIERARNLLKDGS